MDLILRLFLFAFLLMATGCVKNEFSIEFDLPEDVETNVRASYHATDKRGGIMIEAVAPLAHGKAAIKGITRTPTLVYLYAGSSRRPTLAYAERGDDIKITGEGQQPEKWNIGGNDINTRWSQWRQAYADTISLGTPKEINVAVQKYVTSHPDDPLSTLLLLTSFSRADDETLFRNLWRSLSGEATDSKWTDLVSRADQPSRALTMPGKLISMAMRSAGNGVDTIRTKSAKASLLFFWNSGLSRRKDYIDSLKSLTKEFPDSSQRIIADVCMEPDSMAWRNPMRSDSLTKALRLWAPAGMADKRLIDLEVRRSPFFIVFSPDGNQRYRGTDIDGAMKKFRNLMSGKYSD